MTEMRLVARALLTLTLTFALTLALTLTVAVQSNMLAYSRTQYSMGVPWSVAQSKSKFH